MNLPPCFTDPEARRVLRAVCEEYRVSVEFLQDLCAMEHSFTGKARVDEINEQIAEIIDRHRDQLPH